MGSKRRLTKTDTQNREFAREIWTQSADHHTGPWLLKMPHNEA